MGETDQVEGWNVTNKANGVMSSQNYGITMDQSKG